MQKFLPFIVIDNVWLKFMILFHEKGQIDWLGC